MSYLKQSFRSSQVFQSLLVEIFFRADLSLTRTNYLERTVLSFLVERSISCPPLGKKQKGQNLC